MGRTRRAAALVATGLLACLVGVGVPRAASADPAFGTAEVTGSGGAGSVAGVRVGAGQDADRFVVDFTGSSTSYTVRYVDQIVADGSGQPVPVQGTAFIEVSLTGVSGQAPSGASSPGLPGILQVVDAGLGFEGTVIYGIGTATKGGFRAFTLPDPPRLVVDVAYADAAPTTTAPAATSAALPSAITPAAPISAGPLGEAHPSDTTSTIILFVCAVVALGAIVVAIVLFGQRRKARQH